MGFGGGVGEFVEEFLFGPGWVAAGVVLIEKEGQGLRFGEAEAVDEGGGGGVCGVVAATTCDGGGHGAEVGGGPFEELFAVLGGCF